MFSLAREMIKNKLTGALLLLVYFSVLSLGLFYLSGNMEMNRGYQSCPLVATNTTFCVDTLDHLGAWQSAFLLIIPSFTLLLFLLIGSVFLPSVAPNLLSKLKYRFVLQIKCSFEYLYSFSCRQLQELFSSGILHPKLYSRA